MQVVGARVKPSYPHSRSIIPAEPRRAFPAPQLRDKARIPSPLRLPSQSLPACIAMDARAVVGSQLAWPRCQAAQPNPVRRVKTRCIRKSWPSWHSSLCVRVCVRVCVCVCVCMLILPYPELLGFQNASVSPWGFAYLPALHRRGPGRPAPTQGGCSHPSPQLHASVGELSWAELPCCTPLSIQGQPSVNMPGGQACWAEG